MRWNIRHRWNERDLNVRIEELTLSDDPKGTEGTETRRRPFESLPPLDPLITVRNGLEVTKLFTIKVYKKFNNKQKSVF